MALDSLNVSLSAELKAWVDQQIRAGFYNDASEYVCDLIRGDQVRMGKIGHMQELVDEARAGGICKSSMDEIRLEARKQAGIET